MIGMTCSRQQHPSTPPSAKRCPPLTGILSQNLARRLLGKKKNLVPAKRKRSKLSYLNGRRVGLDDSGRKEYPHKSSGEILVDLVKTTPGEEGKWFAAAKEVGLYDEALALASRTPCDPKTLTRAARDFSDRHPRFAVGAGLLALHWLVQGFGYELPG